MSDSDKRAGGLAGQNSRYQLLASNEIGGQQWRQDRGSRRDQRQATARPAVEEENQLLGRGLTGSDLRCFLRLGERTLTETWLYQYIPFEYARG